MQEIRAGDTVIIPPNVRHWHGAAPDKLFSHLAMSEQTDKGEGTAEWSGTSTGVDITGDLKWTKADGTVLNYTFKGTKQPSK